MRWVSTGDDNGTWDEESTARNKKVLSDWEDDATAIENSAHYQDEAIPAASFRVISGADQGLSVTVAKPIWRAGRSLANDLVLRDISVSRHHLQVSYSENGFVAQDLTSGNGTMRLSEYQDKPFQLFHSDCVELGNTILQFQCPSATRRVGSPDLAVGSDSNASAAPSPHDMITPTAGVPIPANALSTMKVDRDENLKKSFPWLLSLLALAGVVGAIWFFLQPKNSQPAGLADTDAQILAHTQLADAPPTQEEQDAALVQEDAAPAPQDATQSDAAPEQDAATKTKQPSPPRGPNYSNVKDKAMGMYRKGQFSTAADYLRKNNSRKFSRRQRSYLSTLEKRLTRLDTYMRKDSSGASPTRVYEAMRSALDVDKSIGSSHSSKIRSRLKEVSGKAAVAYMAQKKYVSAKRAADAAERYGSSSVKVVRGGLETRAKLMYQEAVRKKSSDPDEAKKLFTTITKIVPKGSNYYIKATDAL